VEISSKVREQVIHLSVKLVVLSLTLISMELGI